MRRFRWAATVAVLGTCAFAPTAGAATSTFERDVLDAVRDAGFEQVLDGDGGPNASAPWYPQVANPPNLDITVLDLDANNGVREAVNILTSRDYPNGVIVPVDEDLSSDEVRYRDWEQARWDGGVDWDDPFGPDTDVVDGREGASLEFMLPYPASVLKTMVAHGIMRQVDAGAIALDDVFAYPGGPSLCGGAASRTVSDWMTQMITVSSNGATCAMILRLHQLDEIDALNEHFDDIGLPSLELTGTSPTTGGNWNPGEISMGSLDTAKLMYLVDGGPGTLWRTEQGDPITADVLSPESRAFLQSIYARQGFNEVLSTTNWCGYTLGTSFPNPSQTYPVQGIPSAAPDEFIQPDGSVEVDGIPYPESVLPCNDAAEVQFSHKTGLTYNFGADTGFVHALPGERRRNYVVSVITNVGNRYTDPVMNTADADPAGPFGCWTEWDVCYSESFARLGGAIDDALAARPQIDYDDATATAGQPFELAPLQSDAGDGARWSVDPALPAGLSLDRATGVISGVPLAAAEARDYEVEATDDAGAGDTVLRLGVNAASAGPPPPPQATDPDVFLSVDPGKLGAAAGGRTKFIVTAGNRGGTTAAEVEVCASAPRSIAIRGGACRSFGDLAPGGEGSAKFKLDLGDAKEKKTYKIKFKATGSNFSQARTKAQLRVR